MRFLGFMGFFASLRYKQHADIIQSSLVVSFFAGSSMIVSFLSQVIMAYLFGTSIEMDAYQAAIALPFTIMGLATNGFGFLLIPIFTQNKNNNGELWRLINTSFSVVIIMAIAVGLFGGTSSKLILRVTASNLSPEKLNLAAGLASIVWIMVSFHLLSSFFISLHHLYKRFITPAVSFLLPPLCMIAGGLLLASRVGIESVVVGGAIGFAVQCLLLSSVVVGHRRFTFSLDARSLNVKGFFLDFVLLVFSFLPFTILQVIDVFWAARLPDGSISYLGYASRVVISLTGLIVQGISTVLFPFFAEYIANGELVILREMILKAIKTILLFAFPIIAILTALRIPLIEIMFQRGEFDQSSTIGVARVLPFYLIGMIGVAPMNILIRGFYSLRDLRTPAKLGFVAIALYILLCGLLVNTFSYLGIGIAYAVYWNFMFILQSVMLSRRIGRFWSNADLAFVLKTAIGAIITGSAVHYSYERLVNERFGVLFGTTFSALIGIIIFLGMCMLDRGRVWMPYPWIRSQK